MFPAHLITSDKFHFSNIMEINLQVSVTHNKIFLKVYLCHSKESNFTESSRYDSACLTVRSSWKQICIQPWAFGFSLTTGRLLVFAKYTLNIDCYQN